MAFGWLKVPFAMVAIELAAVLGALGAAAATGVVVMALNPMALYGKKALALAIYTPAAVLAGLSVRQYALRSVHWELSTPQVGQWVSCGSVGQWDSCGSVGQWISRSVGQREAPLVPHADHHPPPSSHHPL